MARPVAVGIDETGLISLDDLRRAINARTRLVAVTAASNVSGAVQPVKEISEIAAHHGIPVLVNAAQIAGHMPFSVAEIGCTFCAMSGHKMLGPSGTGIFVMDERGADLLSPARPGGGTVEFVDWDTHVDKTGPEAFEPGNPNAEGVAGLSAALDYLDYVGLERIHAHVNRLTRRLREGLEADGNFRMAFAPGRDNTGIVSFSPTVGMDVGLLAQILSDSFGIALRHGHHCAQPFYAHVGAPPALRASLHLYNTEAEIDITEAEIDILLSALKELVPL